MLNHLQGQGLRFTALGVQSFRVKIVLRLEFSAVRITLLEPE